MLTTNWIWKTCCARSLCLSCLQPIEHEKKHVVHILCVWAPLKHISIKRYVLSLSRLFPEACLVGAKLVYFGRSSEPMPQNLGLLCRWALLSHLIAERSCYGHAAAAGSKLCQLSSAPPFPSAISPQSCTADHWKTLISKFTQTPNMLGAKVLVFMQQQNPFMQNNKLCMVHTKKYEIHNNIVRCRDLSQENKIYTLQHQCIHYRKPSLKIRPHSPETSTAGCK